MFSSIAQEFKDKWVEKLQGKWKRGSPKKKSIDGQGEDEFKPGEGYGHDPRYRPEEKEPIDENWWDDYKLNLPEEKKPGEDDYKLNLPEEKKPSEDDYKLNLPEEKKPIDEISEDDYTLHPTEKRKWRSNDGNDENDYKPRRRDPYGYPD